jgi:glycosyltransferase involved in cell wall biosynthesis
MPVRVVICRSNPIAPDPRVEKTARTLAGAGYEVSLLGWDRSGQAPWTPQVENGLRVYRIPIRAEFGTGLGNLPNLLRWQVGLFRWLARRRDEYDLIHACDFDTVLPALLCKRLWDKRVVYDIFDFYADHLRATPEPLKRMIRALDLRAIGWADALILVDDSRWKQIEGARPQRSAVIYNSPEEIPLAQGRSPSVASPGLHLAYVGLLQVERGLFEMLAVLEKHPEWRLDLAGFGGDGERIAALAQGMPNVAWHGRVPYERALKLSQAADVLFATYDPAIPNHRFSSPNKVFEAMLLGKPVIVARGTNMDRLIDQAGCGMVVEYGDVPALEAALQRLHSDEALRCRLGENGRRAYETSYSWAVMQRRLLDLYGEVLKAK